jgi:hypothetical protein
MLANKAPQTGSFGQAEDRGETRARHEVWVIEHRGQAVAHSHLPDALREC